MNLVFPALRLSDGSLCFGRVIAPHHTGLLPSGRREPSACVEGALAVPRSPRHGAPRTERSCRSSACAEEALPVPLKPLHGALRAEEETEECDRLHLNVAVAYSARADMAQAAARVVALVQQGRLRPDEVGPGGSRARTGLAVLAQAAARFATLVLRPEETDRRGFRVRDRASGPCTSCARSLLMSSKGACGRKDVGLLLHVQR